MQDPITVRQQPPKTVLDLARQYLSGITPPRDCRWRLTVGRRVAGGWYFDYSAEWVRPRAGRPTFLASHPATLSRRMERFVRLAGESCARCMVFRQRNNSGRSTRAPNPSSVVGNPAGSGLTLERPCGRMGPASDDELTL